MLELNKLYLMDCMEGMREFPDKYFDLAIVDPPYGIGMAKWDIKPDEIYFRELFRLSKEQIIWGMNHFKLPTTNNFIFWDKKQQGKQARGELAWTSTGKVKYFLREWQWDRNNVVLRQHVCQKPIQLYKWILRNYAKPDFKIIDTHVGSGSSIIAFLDYGCEWIGFEIDEDYHSAATKRIEIHKKRPKPFFTDGELAEKTIKQKGFFDQ